MPNAETKCASGNCAIKQCLPGYYDCDPTMAPGCESRLDGKPDPKASNVFCGDCWKGCLDGGTCAQSDASYSGYSCP